MEDERRREIGLFRYALIREAADAGLTRRERGALVRQLAARDHVGPDGRRVRVSRPTLDRWIRAWRAGGWPALLPPPRRGAPRTDRELLALAELGEARASQPHRRAHRRDPRRPHRRGGAVGAHHSAPPRPPGSEPSRRRP